MYVRILVCTPPLEPTDWGQVEFGRRLGGSHLEVESPPVFIPKSLNSLFLRPGNFNILPSFAAGVVLQQ